MFVDPLPNIQNLNDVVQSLRNALSMPVSQNDRLTNPFPKPGNRNNLGVAAIGDDVVCSSPSSSKSNGEVDYNLFISPTVMLRFLDYSSCALERSLDNVINLRIGSSWPCCVQCLHYIILLMRFTS